MPIDRNLGFELVRATEAAAIHAGRWVGRGDKNAADQAAVDAMRTALQNVSMDGVIVIGEGEKDEAPMLFTGEHVGNGSEPLVDIAVDPIEGTALVAEGMPGSIAVVATAEHGTLFATPGIMYMDKICVGAGAVGAIDINASVADNIHSVARALGKDVNDLTIILLERPRHAQLVEEIRATGARIRKIAHGEVLAALMAVGEEPTVDILIGVGGAPETVVIACLLLCAGGEIQARLWPRNGAEREIVARENIDITRVYTTTDLCRGEDVAFAATGITSSDGLRGVQYTPWGARTQSVVTRSRSGTLRVIESRHPNRKLAMLGDPTVPNGGS